MKPTGDSKVWSIEVLITETTDVTEAEAVLGTGPDRHVGWGHARRNPADPGVPRIGEELATARALSDLAHKLLDAAATAIEAFEGRPVHPHP